MTSSDFLTSRYAMVSYPGDYLIRYFQLANVRPEIGKSLAAHPDFEMVPMPKTLVRSLQGLPAMAGRPGLGDFPGFGGLFGFDGGTSFMDPSGFFGLDPERVLPTTTTPTPVRPLLEDRMVARSVSPLSKLMRGFLSALETGNVKEAMSKVSPTYRDRAGNGGKHLEERLVAFVKATGARKVMVTNARNIEAFGDQISATVDAAVEAGDSASTVVLDLVFEREGGDWKIAGIDKH